MPMEQALELATSENLGRLAEDAGMVNLLNHGAASCVHSEGCNGVSQEHLERFAALLLEAPGKRSADYLRRAIKAEAKCEVLELNLDFATSRLTKLEQWATDCRDQVLYPVAQRDDEVGKAADGFGQALACLVA